MTRSKKLEALGYPLDRVPKPGAIYRRVVVEGRRAYVSGAVPYDGEVLKYRGKVSSDLTLEEAQRAAALCAANNLRMILAEVGSLERIERVIRLTGYVNTDIDFLDHHLVINGASQLLIDVLGEEAGVGARSAVGMAQLPLGAAVETELIVRLHKELW